MWEVNVRYGSTILIWASWHKLSWGNTAQKDEDEGTQRSSSVLCSLALVFLRCVSPAWEYTAYVGEDNVLLLTHI